MEQKNKLINHLTSELKSVIVVTYNKQKESVM